ncbi:MAG TPA: hypothetical protein VK038_11020, partial [Ornithinicoccus sp.]|nr:hypothetical protein [Ornithinicoccus sp.]
IVDQHATWIAVNPVQGCPKSCSYCFLNERGQTAVRPDHLADPAQTVELLLASPFYAPDRAVALYTWTDVMALPTSRDHLVGMLEVLAARQVANPVVLITKCHVPDVTIEAIVAARAAGLEVIVYLSYSGLDRSIERGIRHDELRANFPRLAASGIPIVHYWRPVYPESAVPDTMRAVFEYAATYSRCSVAAGLKVEDAALARLSGDWPELATTPGVTAAEGVYPAPFWDFIHATADLRPDYPLFHTNSCALAHVTGQGDRFGVHGTSVCTDRNNCPPAQRDRCATTVSLRPALTDDIVVSALTARGIGDVAFTLDRATRTVVVDAALATNVAAALTHDLSAQVHVTRQVADSYWASGTAGALPLVIGEPR